MNRLTDINVVKNLGSQTMEIILEFDDDCVISEVISPVIESPLGVATRLEHLADMIRKYHSVGEIK